VLIWASATYTVTTRRLITRRGVITRRGHDIPLSRISDVAYELGPIDRMLGCGTLIVSDASTHGRVVMHDIPDVEQTQRKLHELLDSIQDRGQDRAQHDEGV
jgi:membrane protein YdbS with pleckstrin-like domain